MQTQTRMAKPVSLDTKVGGWILPAWQDVPDSPAPKPSPDKRSPGKIVNGQENEKLATSLDRRNSRESLSSNRPGVAVLADVANLDMVCRDQYGYHCRLHYGQLLRSVQARSNVLVSLAFVPDIPQTLMTRYHLRQHGFTLDLLRPKYSHGFRTANADAAMAAFAVRWASESTIQRVELWTGDGDFLRVYDAIQQAWPEVTVLFRSFETGTAMGIQALETAWKPIAAWYVRSLPLAPLGLPSPRASLNRTQIHKS